PDSRARRGTRPRSTRGQPGPPLCRGEDGAPRPARSRLVQGRRTAARVAETPRLGRDSELGHRGQPASAAEVTPSAVLLTGGTRGIGREVARQFAQDGATRIALGYLRNDSAAEEAADELRGLGAEPVLVRGNVASAKIAGSVAALGPLDAVV